MRANEPERQSDDERTREIAREAAREIAPECVTQAVHAWEPPEWQTISPSEQCTELLHLPAGAGYGRRLAVVLRRGER